MSVVLSTTEVEYICDMEEKGVVKLQNIATDEKVVDSVDHVVVQGEVCVLQRQAWCGPSQEGVMIDRLDSSDSEHNRV